MQLKANLNSTEMSVAVCQTTQPATAVQTFCAQTVAVSVWAATLSLVADERISYD